MQNNLQGTVLLRAVVGKDGRVQDILLISGPPMLASAVLDAVRKWRYKPYYRNGEPVEVETQIKVDFSITPK
jgi:protein TonB